MLHYYAVSFFSPCLYKGSLFLKMRRNLIPSVCTCTISYEYVLLSHHPHQSIVNATTYFAVFCSTLFNADSSSVLEISVLDGVTELKEQYDIITQA